MYVISGAGGQTGSVAARRLLASGARVRVIVRRESKASRWRALGAECHVADLSDRRAVACALRGAEAFYIMNPPAYRSDDLCVESDRIIQGVLDGLHRSSVERVVVLSSIGAQVKYGTGNIRTNWMMEQAYGSIGKPVAFVRPAYFMQNWAWGSDQARNSGILSSFLAPLDRAIPMVSTEDIGQLVADTLRERWEGRRVIELSGPAPYSPDEAADALGKALDRPVRACAVPEELWAGVFSGQAMRPKVVDAWIEMFQAFNSGLIRFEETHEWRQGNVGLRAAVNALRPAL